MPRVIKPEAEKTTDWYLWELLYECSLPQIALLSDDYIRLYGMPTSGVAAIDNEMAQQWTHTWMSPQQMVEYHMKGIPIRVTRHEDTKTIYNHIQNHLNAWRNAVSGGLNNPMRGNVQAELVAFDQFAAKIFDHARGYMKDTQAQGKFMRALDAKGHGDLAKELDSPEKIREDNETVQRDSMSGVFKTVGMRQQQKPPQSPSRSNRWL